MPFKATLTFSCWKEHRCVGCGGSYRYKFTRMVNATAETEAAAGAAVEAEAMKKATSEVDERPCPECGSVQSDMLAQRKSHSHSVIFWVVACVALVLLILAGIPSATWMPYSLAATVVGTVSLLGVLAHWVVGLGNPNGNKQKNLDKAAKLVEEGELEVVKPSNADRAEGDPPAVAASAMLWLLLATASVPLIGAPALLKSVTGWSSNADVKPEVIGPGDRVRIYMGKPINCVQSLWTGVATATAQLADGRTVSVPVQTRSDTWGNEMRVKSSEKDTRPTLWADVTLPPEAAGQKVQLDVKMVVRYPTMGIGNNFTETATPTSQNRVLVVSSAGAGHTYWLTFWAMVAGSVLLAFAGWMLSRAARGLREFAPDTRIAPIREGSGRRSASDEDENDWKK